MFIMKFKKNIFICLFLIQFITINNVLAESWYNAFGITTAKDDNDALRRYYQSKNSLKYILEPIQYQTVIKKTYGYDPEKGYSYKGYFSNKPGCSFLVLYNDGRYGYSSGGCAIYYTNSDNKTDQELCIINEKPIEPIFATDWVYNDIAGKYVKNIGYIKYSKYLNKMQSVFDFRSYSTIDKEKSEKRNISCFKEKLFPTTNTNIKLKFAAVDEYYNYLWFMLFGMNCYYDVSIKNPDGSIGQVRCFNEIDTHDYNRYYFLGSKSLDIKGGELEAYKKYFNAITISKTDLKDIEEKTKKEYQEYLVKNKSRLEKLKNGNKQEKEQYKAIVKEQKNKIINNYEKLLIYTLNNRKQTDNNKNDKNNNKILILVPHNKVNQFMNIIKKLPDNALSNFKGYVWFLSKQGSNVDGWGKVDFKFKYSSLDTKPNQKYDDELNRVSNGNLKAKYGKYLTKERYSEDYVAPSIYNNNYNDEPEW